MYVRIVISIPHAFPLHTSAFSCTDHHMKKGKLFLSEGYLCFDTHFSLGENKVVVPIKRIFEVVKV